MSSAMSLIYYCYLFIFPSTPFTFPLYIPYGPVLLSSRGTQPVF